MKTLLQQEKFSKIVKIIQNYIPAKNPAIRFSLETISCIGFNNSYYDFLADPKLGTTPKVGDHGP